MITLRKVNKNDALLLLKWKNEADTRANSIVTDEKIELLPHLKWLRKTLNDPKVEFFIILVDDKPMGDVRLERIGTEREISIRMDKKCRGKGLATQVIGMFRGEMTAKIRTHNIASMRVFIANGYKPTELVEHPAPYYIFKK